MNYTIKLDKVAVPVSKKKSIVIEGFKLEVTDLNILEAVQVAKEIPGIVRELRRAIEEDLTPPGLPLGLLMAHPAIRDLFTKCTCGECGETSDDTEEAGEFSYWPSVGHHVQITLNNNEEDAPIVGEVTDVAENFIAVNGGEPIFKDDIFTLIQVTME